MTKNGNITTLKRYDRKSRGIAYITYDLNNNTKQIYFMNGSVTKYVYSASGQKLRAVHYTAKPNISRTWGVKPAELTSSQILQADSTDYLLGGSLTLKNGKVDKYLFDGGYAQASVASSTSDNFTFYYYTPDHLGNIREVVNASGSVQQVTNYYLYGAPYAESTAADFQPYKYNGKELDKMHGLNTYDYGARQYDPILARWDRLDPLCEKYYNVSPYAYCANSPIILVDPDGKEVRDGLGSYNEENKNLKALVKYLAKHNDSKSIMIVAHGVMRGNEKYASSINIQTYNPKTNEWSDNYISDGKDLSAFLSKNSKVWNNYKAGKIDAEDLHIVFYSCSSSEAVKKISSDSEFKDVTFIAPTKDIGVTAKGEVIVSDLKKNSKGNLVIDNSPGKGPGNWNTIRNGKFPAFSQYSRNSDLKPGTAKFIYK